MNNLTLAFLDEARPAQAGDLRTSELALLHAQVADAKSILAAREARLKSLIERKLGDRVQAALAEKGQDTGTVHVEDDGLDVAVTIGKRVDWDQEKLRAALDRLPAEDAKHYAKVVVTVEERKFNSAPPKIRKALMPARSVRPATPTYTFKPVAAEEAA